MSVTRVNAMGNNLPQLIPDGEPVDPLRESGTTGGDDALTPSQERDLDKRKEAQAERAAQFGDKELAAQIAEGILDPVIRQQVFLQIFGGTPLSTNVLEFQENGVGIRNPQKLFFMMVFYLVEFAPNIEWDDILSVARDQSGLDEFRPLTRTPVPAPVLTEEQANVLARRLQQLRQGVQDQVASIQQSTKEKVAEINLQERRDGEDQSEQAEPPTRQEQQKIVWPWQNLPVIESINKTVEWPTDLQVTTFPEPILKFNQGGGPLEVDARFTYYVGIGGLEDTFDEAGVDRNPWTVEEVMAMAYLSTSLIYPFVAPGRGIDREQDEDVLRSQNSQSQYPIIFMRHWQYFPFLTPFVVRGVTIAADDENPMIINNPVNLGEVDAHVSIPACRQKLDITLNLISAHYYLAAFDESTQEQMREQTSGKTYLDMSRILLKGRGL